MSNGKNADPQLPAKVTDAIFEPLPAHEPPRGMDHHRQPHHAPHARAPLSFSGRMFNVGWKGWTRLVLVCVIVGTVFQAGGFNPFAPGFTIGAGVGQIVQGVINIGVWAAQNGGIPLILGALAVLPFWIGWRALVTLFNKDKPPGPQDRILPKERPRKPHKL